MILSISVVVSIVFPSTVSTKTSISLCATTSLKRCPPLYLSSQLLFFFSSLQLLCMDAAFTATLARPFPSAIALILPIVYGHGAGFTTEQPYFPTIRENHVIPGMQLYTFRFKIAQDLFFCPGQYRVHLHQTPVFYLFVILPRPSFGIPQPTNPRIVILNSFLRWLYLQ